MLSSPNQAGKNIRIICLLYDDRGAIRDVFQRCPRLASRTTKTYLLPWSMESLSEVAKQVLSISSNFDGSKIGDMANHMAKAHYDAIASSSIHTIAGRSPTVPFTLQDHLDQVFHFKQLFETHVSRSSAESEKLKNCLQRMTQVSLPTPFIIWRRGVQLKALQCAARIMESAHSTEEAPINLPGFHY